MSLISEKTFGQNFAKELGSLNEFNEDRFIRNVFDLALAQGLSAHQAASVLRSGANALSSVLASNLYEKMLSGMGDNRDELAQEDEQETIEPVEDCPNLIEEPQEDSSRN